MKKLDFKEIILPALILVVICAVTTALLAGTNLLTKDTIAQLKTQAETEARQSVLPDAKSFQEVTGDNAHFVGLEEDGVTPVGYVFMTETTGYGGDIKVMTGISADAKVVGVQILEQNETPGLGANATNPAFTDQFKRDISGVGFTLGVSEMGIDALTGATITSRAVLDAVNRAVESFQKIQNGGENPQ